MRGPLPDPACTPGAVFEHASTRQICTIGYTRRVRDVPPSLKAEIYGEYGLASEGEGRFEVDHLVPLEVGGSNSPANLWPERAPGFGEKDAVENELHDAVCAGRLSLHAAQVAVARDWRHASVAVAGTSAAQDGGAAQARGAAQDGGAAQARGAAQVGGEDRTGAGAGTPSGGRSNSTFCDTHACIANFGRGRGSVVQCADGEWSHSGGRPGVCARHGGPR